MLEKTYSPADIEARIAKAWEDAGAFKAMRPERAGAEPYCIVIPPPNVTGSLHMGHALNNTLQDVLCRFERMRGKDVLWQPGTDHAGIATQMVVERQLAERQQPGRRDMGREAFLKRVWEWRHESGGTIVNQLKRLGASCDWSRERFTMGSGAPDDQMMRAVAKVFVDLHKAGLIYRDKRLVNWDPKLLTAISDLEVEQIEKKGSFSWKRESGEPIDLDKLNKVLDRDPSGHLYYFDYPLVDAEGNDTGRVITVATTRPETMLGDSGVAVHPEDERYKDVVTAASGMKVRLPLVGRLIPIVADEYSDPEKGTGAVKITPAHDFNDFEVGQRHGLAKINIFDPDADVVLTGNSAFGRGGEGQDFYLTLRDVHGLPRFEARKKIVAMIAERGLLAAVEITTHTVPHGDRGGVPIEPFLTDQWYVDAKTMAKEPIAAVRDGRTTFVPRNWEKTYFEWMENIQPWCVSRQLWWGHQIPAWYSPIRKNGDGTVIEFKREWGPMELVAPEIFVEIDEAAALAAARTHFGRSDVRIAADKAEALKLADKGVIALYRDPDVLDTWFSSALWPFSTLGWPDDTPEQKRFYKTDVLVTAFDIIFFWVARMMMMGLHFKQEVPFHTVYIHAIVRDEKGAKMSKSKGNVIDPLVLIDKFGADALRFTLAAMAAQGRDIKLAESRVEGYRNFATKLWNATRFASMNGCARVPGFDPKTVETTLARWIVGEAAKTVVDVEAGITAYKFNEAAGAAYRFIWNVFCDWHLEFAKPVFAGTDEKAKAEVRAATAWTLDVILKLLHPFMPFVTEEIWAITGEEGPAREGVLALAAWPKLSGLEDPAAEAEIGWLVDTIVAVRSVRSEMNVPAGGTVPLALVGASKETIARAGRYEDLLKRLARLSSIEVVAEPPKGAAQMIVRGETIALPLAGLIDVGAEIARQTKALKEADGDIARAEAKLGNEKFLANAAEEVVEEQREKREEALARKLKIEAALALLKGMN